MSTKFSYIFSINKFIITAQVKRTIFHLILCVLQHSSTYFITQNREGWNAECTDRSVRRTEFRSKHRDWGFNLPGAEWLSTYILCCPMAAEILSGFDCPRSSIPCVGKDLGNIYGACSSITILIILHLNHWYWGSQFLTVYDCPALFLKRRMTTPVFK